MTVAVLALAASLVPLLLPCWGQGEFALDGGRSCAWVLLPWVALIGLPRRASALSPLVAGAALLPPLALGVAADLRAGRAPGDVAATALAGLLLAALLALAARRADGARAHGILWLALVPGAAALAVASDLAGWQRLRDGAGALPLAWIAHAARGASDAAPWGALAAGALLLGAAALAGRRAGAAP